MPQGTSFRINKAKFARYVKSFFEPTKSKNSDGYHVAYILIDPSLEEMDALLEVKSEGSYMEVEGQLSRMMQTVISLLGEYRERKERT